jgi:ferritin-like metal-binding protein YciE
MADRTPAQEIYIIGLKNAHAMENQALSIMRPQLERLEHYPEMSRQLEAHIKETEEQLKRLDQLLDQHGESSSSFKDTILSAFGSMASAGHVAAGDEILKNSFANSGFENYEIGAYTSLITCAEVTGDAAAKPLLEKSLQEEQRMAKWIADNTPMITRRFLELKESEARADV